MALEDLINQLRKNDPKGTGVNIHPGHFRNDNDVVAAAQALHGNEYVKSFSITVMIVYFSDYLQLNWDPLFRELASREQMESASIFLGAAAFLNQMFQPLQQNTNFRSLSLHFITFSGDKTAGFVSFLNDTPSMTELTLSSCNAASDADARNIATALQRNTTIQTLLLHDGDAEFLRPLLQSLASPDSASQLSKLAYHDSDEDGEVDEEVASSLQHFLESDGATIQSFELSFVKFNCHSENSKILQGLNRNTTLRELVFDYCFIGPRYNQIDADIDEGEDERDAQAHAQQLANLVRTKTGLESLRISGVNLLKFPQISGAVGEVLMRRRGPTLLCLDIALHDHYEGCLQADGLRSLLLASAKGKRLERLVLRNISFEALDEEHGQVLEHAIPLLKVKELFLYFKEESEEDQEERLMDSLKKNFNVQSVKLTRLTYMNENNNWLSKANQTQLDFFLNRNCKLAQWIEKPKLVPKELWPEAMKLALEAGAESLYLSLLSLSKLGTNLREQGRKRKRPQYYKPAL